MSDQQTTAQELTLQDLAAMRSIIQICTERGAFKPSELALVGTLYNKLDVFLVAVEQQQNTPPAIKQDDQTPEGTPNA